MQPASGGGNGLKAEQIIELVDAYRECPCSDTREPLDDAIIQNSAERRQLAKHCVVVISDLIGTGAQTVWCTFCQVRVLLNRTANENKLVHHEDCLVAKIEAEG